MRNAFIRGLTALAEKDDRVLFLTADLGYKIFDDFARRFPGRFLNVGVAEANMIGVAAGLALEGYRPFAYSIVPFATLRCFEQIRNDVCYNGARVTVVGVGGGYAYGPNGPTHHAVEDIALLRTLPDMAVVCPGDPVEAELAVAACAARDGPSYLRLGRAGDPVVHTDRPPFVIGRALPVREGGHGTLLATGSMLPVAVEVARTLADQGCPCAVLSMPTIKPLDVEVVLRACDGGKPIFTLEEHGKIGGFGSAVAECLFAHGRTARLEVFAAEDRFLDECGSQAYLRRLQGLDAATIAARVLSTVRA